MKIGQFCQRQRCRHVELEQFLAGFRVARGVVSDSWAFLFDQWGATFLAVPFHSLLISGPTKWVGGFKSVRLSPMAYTWGLYEINVKIYDNVTITECMQYYDVITNSRWRTIANITIIFVGISVKKWSDYYDIWCTESEDDFDKITWTKFKFLNSRWRTNSILRTSFLAITRRWILWNFVWM